MEAEERTRYLRQKYEKMSENWRIEKRAMKNREGPAWPRWSRGDAIRLPGRGVRFSLERFSVILEFNCVKTPFSSWQIKSNWPDFCDDLTNFGTFSRHSGKLELDFSDNLTSLSRKKSSRLHLFWLLGPKIWFRAKSLFWMHKKAQNVSNFSNYKRSHQTVSWLV